MVPKVAGKGASFKGAGAYYLHDKGAATSDRVVFTYTENLPTNDPELALKAMAYTAMHQDEIKARAGLPSTGRKSAQSVYTYSLSWAPGEQPTREEMIAAGKESLEALGLQDHEVLMVAHDDEPHPHLHLIVGRVHPETGRMEPLSKDYLKLSRWAEDYERRQGEIRCEQRVENNEKRRNGQFVKYRDSFDAAAFHKARKAAAERAFRVRQAEAANLPSFHRGQRQALYDHKEQRVAAARDDIRALNRPKWAELYRQQREEWKALNDAQRTAYGRLRYFLKERGHDGRAAGDGEGLKQTAEAALRAVFGLDNPHGALSRKHQAERQALATDTRAQNRAAARQIAKGYKRELSALKRTQHEETRALQVRHSQESQQRAREVVKGRQAGQIQQAGGPRLTTEFERRAWEQIRKAQERQKRDRERGKDRDGGRER